MRWTRKTIIAEINRLHESGEPLNYSAAEGNHLNLVRAAAWHFGTWRHAVESAGVNYESLSRYQRWSKARIIERIVELHKQKQDLSWRAVSTEIDPPLAAAALRPNGFQSWREALSAAGINVENIARYKYWDEAKVLKTIRARKRAGEAMSSKSLQISDQPLFCAARRRFGSWDSALDAAGLNAEKIRLRRHNPSLNAPRVKKADASIKAVDAKAVPAKSTSVKVAPAKAVASKVVSTIATKASAKTPAKKMAPKKAAPVSPNGIAALPVKVAAKKAAPKAVGIKPKLTVAKPAPVKAPASKSPTTKTAATKASVRKATVTKAAATKTPASKAAAKKVPAAKTPATKIPAAKTAASKAPATKIPAKTAAKKTAAKRATR